MTQPISSHLPAIVYALAGYSFWVAADSLIKLAGSMPVPKYEVIGVAAFSGMVVLALIAVLRKRPQNLVPRHYGWLSLLGVLMVGTYAVAVLGLRILPLANFYTVVFMAPIVVGFLAARIFHEKMEWQKIAATVAGFIGVIIAIGVFSLHDHAGLLGYGYALISMLVTVTQQLIMRFLGDRESRECTALYPRIGPVLACIAAGFIWGFEPMPLQAWLCSLLIGSIGCLGWFCVAEAYKHAPAATVAPYQYTQIVSGGLLGYLLWGDLPSAHLLVGAAIIMASGIYIALHTRKAQAVPAILEI